MINHSRRFFMQKSAMLASGIMLMPKDLLAFKGKVGIQLYTVREMMDKDPVATLEMLSAIGFTEMESAGYGDGKYYGMSAGEFKKVLTDNGLTTPSAHYVTPVMKSGWEKAIEDAKTAGQNYMVCAYLFPNERETLDQYKELATLLNKSGEACKQAGIQFCYHNHDFEFQEMDGTIPYDILLNETDKDLVKMELDLFWTAKAGVDPVKLFEESPGRYPLWHVKDMNEEGEFAAVGTGTIDFKRIFKGRKTAGVKHFFVEQDQINGDVKQTITTSYQAVQKMV